MIFFKSFYQFVHLNKKTNKCKKSDEVNFSTMKLRKIGEIKYLIKNDVLHFWQN